MTEEDFAHWWEDQGELRESRRFSDELRRHLARQLNFPSFRRLALAHGLASGAALAYAF